MVRHKSFFLFVASLIILLRCIAYTDAEMHDQTNLWYGSEANLDEVWAGILESMKPPTNVIMEYEAFQVTNRIPVLAEIMASNREYAVRMGLDTNVITWSLDEYRSLMTPPPLELGESRTRQEGRHLMALMGVTHGDETLVCNTWTMPTNILVCGISYSFATDDRSYFHVVSTTNAQKSLAKGYLERCANGKEARIHGFAQRKALITAGTPLTQALNLSVRNLDSATNMLFLCSSHGNPSVRDVLIYKNLVLHMCAETNTVNAAALAAEIINAGLPEGERVALLPMP